MIASRLNRLGNPRSSIPRLAALWLLALLVGCGKPAAPTGTVSGKVTLSGGKPLTNAEISFIAPQLGSSGVAQLGADGSYTLPMPLKAGKHQVAVAPPAPVYGPDDAPGSKPNIENADIPSKFRSHATSGLTADVKAGANEFSFELKPQ